MFAPLASFAINDVIIRQTARADEQPNSPLPTHPTHPPLPPPQARRDLTEAGELGHPGALYEHGVMQDEGKAIPQDYQRAFDHYMKCASIPEDPDEAGHLEADQVHPSQLVRKFETEFLTNLKQLPSYQVLARYRLGRLFELGFGDVVQNEFQAVEWYGKADGYSHAQLALGDCYRRGRGCRKDLNRSLEVRFTLLRSR